MDSSRPSGWAHDIEEEQQEALLLREDYGDSDLELDEEEAAWIRDAKSPKNSTRKTSRLRIALISLFIILTISLVVHTFAVPSRNKNESPISASGAAKLRSEDDYILDPGWDFSASPTIREYHWTISDHELNPDGVYRPMILINRQFPGPLIECNEGDEIVVHVHNRAENATSIHWHGLYQNGSNWMDGTVGITQCPIAPGADFTYRFKVQGQSGTYWYHSHLAAQATDGLVGPLVIHSRQEKEMQKVEYQTDRVVMVQDHYYDLSSVLLMQYLEPDRENAEPVPDSALINGRNVRNCADLPNRRCDNSSTTHALFDLNPTRNHRLRFINVGAFAEFQIQVDEHEFAVTEVDGTDVWPVNYHRLNINPAQRYSIVLRAEDRNQDAYWLRARMITHCFAEENDETAEEAWGIVRYGPSNPQTPETPISRDWPEIIEVECRDLNTTDLYPVDAIPAPATHDTQIYLRSNFEIGAWRLSRGFFNSSSFRPSISSPSLHRLINGYSSTNTSFTSSLSTPYSINTDAFNSKRELVYQTTGIQTLDILIQNFDDGNHPMHLHGYKFFVLAQGHGYPPSTLYDNLNLTNPLRRDTASVEAFGWTLLRVVADNPGVWAFHCHITWHSEAGLVMQFLTRAEVVAAGWEVDGEGQRLCGLEGREKGKGPEDEIWFGGKIGGRG